MFNVPKAPLGNFYNDGIGGIGPTDMRTAMLVANRAGCGCKATQTATAPASRGFGSWIGDLFSSAGSGALNIVKSAGAGEAATRLEEQRIAAAAAAQAAAAPKPGVGGISTNTMLLVGAGAVGVVALILLSKKKG